MVKIENRITLLICFVTVFFCSCVNDKSASLLEENCDQVLFVNLDSNEDQISFFDVFENISLIELETCEESLLNNIDKILFNKDSIFVMDKKQGVVFLFDSNGRYLNKLSQQGDGPEEYFDLTDFALNEYTNNIELLSAYRGIYCFDMNFKFVKKISFDNKDIPVHRFAIINSNTRAVFNTVRSHRIEIFNIDNKKVVEKYFEIPLYVYRDAALGGPFLFENKKCGNTFFSQPFCNTVYSIFSTDIIPEYKWDFGKYNFSIGNLKPNLSQNEYDDITRSDNFRNSYVYHFTANDNNSSLYLAQFAFGSENEIFTVLYDKMNGKYKKISKFEEGVLFPYYPILTEDYIYAIVSDNAVLNVYIGNNIKMDSCVDMTKNREDMNPMILRYKLRK